jgi:hypothetical protein
MRFAPVADDWDELFGAVADGGAAIQIVALIANVNAHRSDTRVILN